MTTPTESLTPNLGGNQEGTVTQMEVNPIDDISNVLHRARERAFSENITIRFEHNDRIVTISPDLAEKMRNGTVNGIAILHFIEKTPIPKLGEKTYLNSATLMKIGEELE